MNNGEIFVWEPESTRGYSVGWNLDTLLKKGVPNHDPPRNSVEFLEQLVLLVEESNKEWGGPISLNSFDNYIAQFLEDENPSKKQFTKQMNQLFYGLKGTNVLISLDLIPRQGFMITEKTQIILDAVNNVIQELFQKNMEKGLFEPYFRINLYPETNWESTQLVEWITLSYKFGEPTYQNFSTGTISPDTLRPKLYKPDYNVTYLRLGGLNGNSEDQSISGFASINLQKLASVARDEQDFFDLVDTRFNEVAEILQIKKKLLEKSFSDGEKPLTKNLMDNLDWSYSVITLVGMNEALEDLINAPLGHVAGKAVTYKLLEHLLRKLEEVQNKNNQIFSLEAAPSEIPGSILLKEYSSKHDTLTPSTDLKSDHGDDLWDVLEHQKKIHTLYTGGTLQQIYLAQGLSYTPGLKLLIKRTFEIFGYNYLAITPIFSLCPKDGYIYGEEAICPICSNKVETHIRVDGLLVKLSTVTDSIKEAYRKRVFYDVKNR